MSDSTTLTPSPPTDQKARPRRAKISSKRQANPLRRGIIAFCAKSGFREINPINHAAETETKNKTDETLAASLSVEDVPKRFTSYPPLLLLPFNFARHSESWARFYDKLNNDEKTELFRSIAGDGFVGSGITHVAISAPIALSTEQGHDDDGDGCNLGEEKRSQPLTRQNVMRSPSGLTPVYGDWGSRDTDGDVNANADAFENAFWVSTSQHKGITQCWAPLYTMFSRGNISEKARILGIESGAPAPQQRTQQKPSFYGLSNDQLGQPVKDVDVVDFYVGIGYFAFCYLMRGVRRVWGWDINPWSIEGLRRGCNANGWNCLVVRVDEHGSLTDSTPKDIAMQILRLDRSDSEPAQRVRCVAFLGDNRWATKVLSEIDKAMSSIDASDGQGSGINLKHANLGLLPSSNDSWESAVAVLSRLKDRGVQRSSWLHVHENVDMTKEDSIREDIVNDIRKIVEAEAETVRYEDQDHKVSCVCLHVQHVKTFAPGVMHCVFDIQIQS
ncbi:hypothetical protein PV10_04874 [Exophiala mesophila]|uniref:tRNA wybutosine-synthesizing protein 2 n=1 Tax=Exophiala mesophila TaxID=212818 RepID=A0A0D1ZIF3_EXOME|nr:uncharacterized protein PV10_04874 [Exophiala mesophila]KIV93679.1 hypothetical protein PV10_04874 [Exophiala mesophila]